ncbi:hypothetical protein Pcinc_017888 [Petrolisthes cinctipes]|uniref:Uncharacterized protein n=1 Tax=Petrolisthes cinctipes TaxID=88211 RepID=A0AAE1FPT0_PETCI|nr:hypothetical protein Pcinc_017888 [Petrolisthes cinctipes]
MVIERRLRRLRRIPTFLALVGLFVVALTIESDEEGATESWDDLIAQLSPQDLCWTSEEYKLIDSCQPCSGLTQPV